MDAIIIPIKPINRKLPNADKSLFVVYPYKLSAPNAIAVVKNVCAIDIAVYAKKIYEIDSPINAAKIQKTSCAVWVSCCDLNTKHKNYSKRS